MARVLVVGAGDIGGGYARHMAEHGHEVWCIRRSEQEEETGVQWIQADVTEPETLANLPEKLDLVLYSVASPEFSKDSYHAYYVDGLKNILVAIKEQNIRRMLFVSSSSVYHQMDGEWVDETTETKPQMFAGKKHLQAEDLLIKSSVPGTVVRFTGIYGPGRNRLIEQARHGGHCDPEPPVWTNRIHRDDCIGVLAYLSQKAMGGEPIDELYLATDDEPATLFDLLEWMKDRIGEVDPDHDMPEVTRRANRRCSNARLKSLGYEFKFSNYREGYDRLLTAMGYE